MASSHSTFSPFSVSLSLSLLLLLLSSSHAQLFGAQPVTTATPGLAATTVPATTLPAATAVPRTTLPGATLPGTTGLPGATAGVTQQANGGIMGLVQGLLGSMGSPAAANTAGVNPAAATNQLPATVRPAAGNLLTNPFGGAVAQNPVTPVNPVNPVAQAQTPWNPMQLFQRDRVGAGQALAQNNQFSIFSRMFNPLLNRATATPFAGALGGGGQPQPLTIFAPTNRAILGNLGTLGRNFFNLPQMLQNHIIRGAYTPQQLNNVPPGTRFQGLFGAAQNPLVRAATRNGAALAMRTANNQVVRAQVGRVIYRGRYLVLYGIDSFLYG